MVNLYYSHLHPPPPSDPHPHIPNPTFHTNSATPAQQLPPGNSRPAPATLRLPHCNSSAVNPQPWHGERVKSYDEDPYSFQNFYEFVFFKYFLKT